MMMMRSIARNGRVVGRILAVAIGLTLAAAPSAANSASKADLDRLADLRQRLVEHLDVLEFDIQAIHVRARGAGPLHIALTIDNQPAELSVEPHSVRAPDFRVSMVGEDGRMKQVAPPPARTYRGTLTGSPDSLVAATIDEGRVIALIRHADELWAVEPVAHDILPGAHNLHVVYRRSDIAPGNWTCGTSHDPVGPRPDQIDDRARGGSVATSCIAVAELAIDVDAEYYQLNNNSVADTTMDVENIINAVNLIYGFQVGIEHLVTDLVIWDQVALDPYTSTSSGTLLGEFSSHRIANPYPNTFDVAHLFTGKELNGSVIGVAWLSAICSPTQQYGLSQSQFTTNVLNRVVLTTHELGHNWSARHCDGDLDCGVMCSAVSSCSGPGDVFGDRSRADIVAFRNSAPCLGDGTADFAATGKLVALDPEPGVTFGVAVDIVDSTVIVGAFQDDEVALNAGAAYIYEFNGSEWVQAPKLFPNPKDHEAGDRFGVDVAIDDDGMKRTAVVGAYLDTGNFTTSGSAYIFRKFKESWTQVQKIVKPTKEAGDLFGQAVDISGDYVIVGAPRDDTKTNDAGAAYIYRDNGVLFEHVKTLTAGTKKGDFNDQYGTSVAICSDPEHGTVALVGAWMDDESGPNSGSVYVYRLIEDGGKKRGVVAGNWALEQKLCPGIAGDQFGYSVAIDRNQIAVGSWLDDEVEDGAGAAYVYTYDPKTQSWPTPEKIVDVVEEDDNFGSSIDIDDGVLVVGAYLDDNLTDTDVGALHTYRRTAAGWVPVGRLEPADIMTGDQLGLSLGLSGDLVIGGAWQHDDTEMNQGASYIFIVAPDPSDCDGSGIPDQCELESGVLDDCNGNSIPDICDITDMTSTDDDLNGIPDECDFDCNMNGTTDSTEIENGSVPDCNENGFPDSCDIDPTDPDGDGNVSADVNIDGIPDECSPDCNGNGIPDSIDISGGGSLDCNSNGIPDECDRENFIALSAQLGPIGAGNSQMFTLNAGTTAPPWAMGDVAVTVAANADIDLTSEYIRLLLDGNLLFELFRSGALECPSDNSLAPDIEARFIPADVWNTSIRRDNEAILLLETSGGVTPGQCASGSWVQVLVSYSAGDCNNNDVLDECEITAGTVPDCNNNGVPDDCELALFDCNSNGVLDDCEFPPADFDGNGAVDVFDLIDLLTAWGPCPGCPEDITDAAGTGPDGAVDVFDLLELLGAWTACP